jgi:Cohesin domain
MLILGTACAPRGPIITVERSVSSLQVNNTERVSVTVENIADLTAFEAHLSFDANVLEVIELDEGGFIAADFIAQNTFDNAAGTIDYAVAQIDHPPANGSGTLFVIVFRAKAPGKSSIRFRETPAAPAGALFSDSNGMAIQVSLINGSVNVGDSGNALRPDISIFAYRGRTHPAGMFKIIPPTASEF